MKPRGFVMALGCAPLFVVFAAMPAGAAAPAARPTALAAPAHVDGAPSQMVGQLSAHRVARLGQTPLTALTVTSTIPCNLNVQLPHNSSHVNGTVNVVDTVTCAGGAVNRIAIRAALYRNGAPVKDSGSKNVYDTQSAQNNAAVPCSNGSYVGFGSFYIDWPAGYVPTSPQSGSGWGSYANIVC